MLRASYFQGVIRHAIVAIGALHESLELQTGGRAVIARGYAFEQYNKAINVLIAAAYLCDRVGRRRLMLSGCTMMGVVLVVGGVLSHEVHLNKANDPGRVKQFGAGVAAILYVYTFIYGNTWLTTWLVKPLGYMTPASDQSILRKANNCAAGSIRQKCSLLPLAPKVQPSLL